MGNRGSSSHARGGGGVAGRIGRDDISSDAIETSGEIVHRDNSLLDIFSEENLHCHNLREMNTSLTRRFSVLQTEVQSSAQQLRSITPGLFRAAGAFLRGEEIRQAEGSLVADMDALSKDVLQKIKAGIYHVAESKQIDGNMRAAVVDENNQIIKQITLKYAGSNKIVAGDLNTLAVQAALKQITQQLECIDAGVQYLITLKRPGDFQTPYFDAVKKIDEAKNAQNDNERNERIMSAFDDLNHGLNGLYGDLDDCLKALGRKWIPVASKRNLNYIAEDIVYIPQYVALLSYLYNYLGKNGLAKKSILYYRDEIDRFVDKQLPNGYSAAQLVHSHFHYVDANRDFWIDGMGRIQSEMTTLKPLLNANETGDNAIYYLSLDDVQEEEINI